MRKLFLPFFVLLFLINCQKDNNTTLVNQEDSSVAIHGVYAKGQKVTVCHNGKIKNISINAVPAHQGHGDGVDLDDDGFFDIANPCSATDCDDNDPSINPDGLEIVYNGIDDDCDAATLDDDLDEDGYILAEDCDDGDSEINPGEEEVCENGIDDNCNGAIDEDCIVLPDPIAFYPFNGNAADESGNGNDGVVNGVTPTADRFGNVNSAYSFDGVNDFVQIPTATENNLGANNFTIAVWIRSTTTDEGVIWNKRNTSSCSQASGPRNGFSQTNLAGGNKLSAKVRSSSSYQLNSQVAVNDGNWHLATLIRNGNTMNLYLDGQLQQTQSISAGIDFSTTMDLFIGKTIYCTGNHYTGDIDDFSIYDVALTAAEIMFLFDE